MAEDMSGLAVASHRDATSEERARVYARLRREAFNIGALFVIFGACALGFFYGLFANLDNSGVLALCGVMGLILVVVEWMLFATIRRSLVLASTLPEVLPLVRIEGTFRMGQRPPRTIEDQPVYMVGSWPRGIRGGLRVSGEAYLMGRGEDNGEPLNTVLLLSLRAAGSTADG